MVHVQVPNKLHSTLIRHQDLPPELLLHHAASRAWNNLPAKRPQTVIENFVRQIWKMICTKKHFPVT